jgi:hypothetical protein
MPPARSRLELEELWKTRVRQAEQDYLRAKAESAKALEEQARGRISSPDGHYGLIHALRMETAAVSEYTRVLRIFNDFILHGTVPKERLYR